MNLTKPFDFGPSRGRGLISIKTINPGENLFEEVPLIACQYSWNKAYGYLACDHCLKPLENTLSNVRRLTNQPNLELPYLEVVYECPHIHYCPNCSTAYCSSECLHMAAKQYHSIMCLNTFEQTPNDVANPLIRLDEIWRQFHYPPETSTIFLLVRLVSVCLSSRILHHTESQHIVDSLQSFLSDTVVQNANSNEKLCHNLLGEQFVSQIEQIHEGFVQVLYYLIGQMMIVFSDQILTHDKMEILTQSGLMGLLEKNVFLHMLCLIGRNGQGIATSSFSLWLTNVTTNLAQTGAGDEQFNCISDQLYEAMEAHVGSFLDNEGVGLYKYQSLINHSCSPNAVVKFTGLNYCLSIEALEFIGENEEITISYLDPCIQSRGRHTRREYLSSHYLFWCDCRKCVQDKLDGALSETSDDEEEEEEGDASDNNNNNDQEMV